MRILPVVFCLIFIPAACELAAAERYEGYTKDLKLLRDHHKIPSGGKTIKASSGKAISAAHRIFANISFLFKTRAEVLKILGDPATISDYGQKMEKKSNSPLLYRFDSGLGGGQYKLSFKKDRVFGIEFRGMD